MLKVLCNPDPGPTPWLLLQMEHAGETHPTAGTHLILREGGVISEHGWRRIVEVEPERLIEGC